jgi:prepilin-type N-terminal cleavage/methylation domain-containing protein
MRRRAGFTLLEVLMAVTLVSLMSVGIVYAMRAGFNTMSKTNARVVEERKMLGAQRILEQMLANLMPVKANCHGGNPLDIKANIFFFQAEPETLRFVSTYSLEEAARGLPRIVEMHVIPGDRGEGVRLIVNEHMYAGPLSTGQFCLGPVPDPLTGGTRMGFAPVEASTRSFVLADRLASCRFLYRRPIPQPPFEDWLEAWMMMPSPLPTAIRVDMQPLAAESGKLRHSPVTVPLHFIRDFEERYEDK